MPLDSAYRHCQKIARESHSNFYLAFHTLPRQMFREMCVLYAYMRHTDDLGDSQGLELEERRSLLTEWRDQLSAALHGDAAVNPILAAMADVAARREIPSQYLECVIDGVEGDLKPRAFATFAELETYCYNVAGVVGLCCVKIWGWTGQEPIEPAIACGTAFQLTNILRDLREDAQLGRIYLPREDLDRFSYSPDDLSQGRLNDQFRELMKFEVDRAWSFYRGALPVLDSLSLPGKRIQTAFFDLYGSLLRKIETHNYDVFSRRIRLSRFQKLQTIARSFLNHPVLRIQDSVNNS